MAQQLLHLRKAIARFGLVALSSLAFASCVYFNTYYNAQKSFRQAEKARLDEERRFAGTDRRNRSGGQESGISPNKATAAVRQPRSRVAGGRAASATLYEKALEKASAVLEEYQERDVVDESDLADDALFLAGRAEYWLKDYGYAAESFADLERNFPNSEYFHEAMYWRGLSLEALGESAQAGVVYRTLVNAAGPKTAAKAGFRLGEMAGEEGNLLVAIQEYAATLEAFPDTDLRAELWLRIGETQIELTDPSRLDSALVAFDRVLEEDPSTEIEYWARLNRGLTLHEKGEVEAARATYLRLLQEGKFRSFEGQTRIVLGQYYQQQDLLAEALEQYEKVRDDFPQTESSAMALFRTGQLYLQEYSDRVRAEEYFREVGAEKGGSEGNRLAKEMLVDMKQLAKTQRRIHKADSLAAVRAAKRAPRAGSSEDPPVPAAAAADSLVVASVDTALQSSNQHEADSEVGPDPLPGEEEWEEEEEEADTGNESDLFIPRPGRTTTASADTSIERAFFTVAEIYRDRLAAPDSAAYYYEEIIRRFSQSQELPRAMYNLAWVRLNMQDDMEKARPALEGLVEQYPQSVHANAARGHLGLPAATTDEDLAVEEFEHIEAIRSEDVSRIEIYLPLLDSLTARYPDTNTAVKSAFLAAWSVENTAGDSTEATRRFDDIVVRYPSSRYAVVGRERRKIRKQGLVDKLARQLAVMGRGLESDERLLAIAVEPTKEDTSALSRKFLGFALRAHRRDNRDKAKELYELSLEQQKKNPRALYGLGEIAWSEAYYEDAVDYFRQALQQDRGMLSVYHHLFAYHLQQSREDSANHYLVQIIKRDRRNLDAQALGDQYPDLVSGNERLDRTEMEEIDLPFPLDRFELPHGFLKLKEEPVLRYSVEAQPSPDLADTAEVVVDVLVSRTGIPEVVEVFDGPDSLRATALAAAKQFLFFPAEGNRGTNPKVWMELVIPIRPGSAADAAIDSSAVASTPEVEAVKVEPEAVGDIDRADASALVPVRADSAGVQTALGDSL